MTPKNNGFWDDTMGEINEKFIAETAEAHAKTAARNILDAEGAVDAGAPIVIPPTERKPISRRRLLVTIGSIAAALVLCVGVGGALISRYGQPTTPVTSGSGADTSETSETSDIPDTSDGENNGQQSGTPYVQQPLDTEFNAAVLRNDEFDDCYLQLSEQSVEQLKKTIDGFKDSEPLTDSSMLVPYAERASIELYSDKALDGEYKIIKLFNDGDGFKGEYDRYYYGITSAAVYPYFTYYEIYFENWVELLGIFGDVPMVMQLTVTENSGDGTYVAKHEKGGQTYLIPTEDQYNIGDEIDVCYYGMPLGEEPFQTNVLWTRYAYDISEDTSPVWSEEAADKGVDWQIFEEHFSGEWLDSGSNPFYLAYSYDQFDSITNSDFNVYACYELEDGYYLQYSYNSTSDGFIDVLLFIPDRDDDTMYKYGGYETDRSLLKNTDRKTAYTRKEKSTVISGNQLEMYSYLGLIGRQRFAELMGEDYAEFSAQFSEDYIDESGRRWYIPFNDLPLRRLTYYLREYSAQKDRAVIVQTYALVGDNWAYAEPEEVETGYVTSVAEKTDGKWQMTDRYLSDYYGNSVYDKRYETISGNYNVTTRYHIDDNGRVTDLRLYTTTRDDTETVVSEVAVENPMVNGGAVTLPVEIYDSFTVATGVQELGSGDLAIMRIPYEQRGKIRYSYTLYTVSDEGKLSLVEGAFPDSSHSRWFPDADNDTVAFLSDKGVDIYKIDFGASTMEPVDYVPDIKDDYALDTAISKADPSMAVSELGFMYGWWGNRNETLVISEYSKDIFDYDDPCLGWYTDGNGVYMVGLINGEYQLWFLPGTSSRDSFTLYRYDNVTEGMSLKLSDYSECYQRLQDESSRYTGYGEMGYIGTMLFCDTQGVNIREFAMQITDSDGVRWVRDHSDFQLEWGYFIETYVNGESAVQMQFLNPETGEMRWLTLPYDFDWRGYYYTGEVHFLDTALSSTDELKTELSSHAKTGVDQSLWGTFLIDENYLVSDDGSIYGVRHMGSNMAQWLGSSEVFCYKNGEWRLISDEYGLCHTSVVDNRLFVTYNKMITNSYDTELWLDVYTGDVLNHSIRIGAGHTNYAWAEVIDGYLVVNATLGVYIYRPEAINSNPLCTDYQHFSRAVGHFTVVIDGMEYSSADGLPACLFD